MQDYHAKQIEARWLARWNSVELYRVDLDKAKRPFYNLMEFPYPSGEGLHIGHFYTYSGADSYGRYQRMIGNDVFQPMGFDAFGIHGENYALRLGENPAIVMPRNITRFREEQIKRMGAAFDWSREVDTTNPEYYAWTQWPHFDPEIIADKVVEIPIQINGKLRDRVEVSIDSSAEAVLQQALSQAAVQKLVAHKQIVKTIYIPNQMLNIVVS